MEDLKAVLGSENALDSLSDYRTRFKDIMYIESLTKKTFKINVIYIGPIKDFWPIEELQKHLLQFNKNISVNNRLLEGFSSLNILQNFFCPPKTFNSHKSIIEPLNVF